MDKFDKALQLTDHPEQFTDDEISKLLADPEIREIYDAISISHSSLSSRPSMSSERVEEQWQKFLSHTSAAIPQSSPQPESSAANPKSSPQPEAHAANPQSSSRPETPETPEALTKAPHNLSLFRRLLAGRRVAVVITVTVTSIAALAFGISFISSNKANKQKPANPQTALTASAPSVSLPDTLEAETPETLASAKEPVIFENETLGEILKTISGHYALKVDTVNPSALNIHLFFRWDPACDAPEIVRQLNNFDRINITLKDSVLIAR